VKDLQALEIGAKVEILLQRDDATALGDDAVVRSCVHELLHNAWKFRDKSDSNYTIQVATEKADARVEIRVTNEGAIPEQVKPFLFEPFFRVASDPTIPGSGLGLWRVKTLVKACGGTVELRNCSPVTMTITLPEAPVTSH
jgi:signal transduction histidine kinase